MTSRTLTHILSLSLSLKRRKTADASASFLDFGKFIESCCPQLCMFLKASSVSVSDSPCVLVCASLCLFWCLSSRLLLRKFLSTPPPSLCTVRLSAYRLLQSVRLAIMTAAVSAQLYIYHFVAAVFHGDDDDDDDGDCWVEGICFVMANGIVFGLFKLRSRSFGSSTALFHP